MAAAQALAEAGAQAHAEAGAQAHAEAGAQPQARAEAAAVLPPSLPQAQAAALPQAQPPATVCTDRTDRRYAGSSIALPQTQAGTSPSTLPQTQAGTSLSILPQTQAATSPARRQGASHPLVQDAYAGAHVEEPRQDEIVMPDLRTSLKKRTRSARRRQLNEVSHVLYSFPIMLHACTVS
jgi:hypothetical protein